MRQAVRLTMKQTSKLALFASSLALATFAVFGGCANNTDSETLWVFAASSLTDAFTEIADAFERANPEIEVLTQFAGSSQLATQIASGAPADVFASANEAVMATVLPEGELTRDRTANEEGGKWYIQGEVRGDRTANEDFGLLESVIFVRNELVVAVPAGNPMGISSISDLSNSNLLLAICDKSVPCGALAHEAATAAGITLSADTEEASVRAVLTKLLLGEVDAGLVYKSDVRATPLIAIAISPPPANTYPISAVSDNPDAAAFVKFVLSPEAQKILAAHDFVSVQELPAQ